MALNREQEMLELFVERIIPQDKGMADLVLEMVLAVEEKVRL